LDQPRGAAHHAAEGATGASQTEFLIAQSTTPNAQDVTRAVQERLAALGYDPGPLDGIAGPKTRDAISSFQAALGLPPDGAISSALLARLNASLEPATQDEPSAATPDAANSTAGGAGSDGAPTSVADSPDFVATWMLGTWRIDCASNDPGLVFDRVAFDKTWSDEWTVSLEGSRVRVCRQDEGRFCYLYEQLSDTRMVFAGHVGESARTPRNIQIQKCE
jgi:hypothetical protein